MAESGWGMPMADHAVVVPLFGTLAVDFGSFLDALRSSGLFVVLVDNNPNSAKVSDELPCDCYIGNANRGGIAGAFNRGVEAAIKRNARWVTLLDQDSRLSPSAVHQLRLAWDHNPEARFVVGPTIWDRARDAVHEQPHALVSTWKLAGGPWGSTRLLISSGTTFATCHWAHLGSFCEGLFIDFVDHAWSFRAQARGFQLLQHRNVFLEQVFGESHPNLLCRCVGMQLYSPMRHYYGLRNLRWLLRQSFIPLDLRVKELVKMLFKPWFWLLFESRRAENLRLIIRALSDPLPNCDCI